MRRLNLNEIREKINDYSSDILYSSRSSLETKITQYLNFLKSQPISSRILERIETEFNEIDNNRNSGNQKEFINSLSTREIQGAFAYFEIRDKFLEDRKNTNHYISISSDWYFLRGSNKYDRWHEAFNEYFFKPFTELIEWYLYESKVQNEFDYFSFEEIEKLGKQFNIIETEINKLSHGQEIIFNEANEIKELIYGLNKKNWIEVIKGKFSDLILNNIISIEIAEGLIETITGEKIKLK